MDIPPDAVELRALWQKGRPVIPLPEDAWEKVLEGLEDDRHWVSRLNAARLAPLIAWTASDREAAIERLLALRYDGNRFVRPWALGAVWRMVGIEDPRRLAVESWMADALASGSAAERARARLLLKEDARRSRR